MPDMDDDLSGDPEETEEYGLDEETDEGSETETADKAPKGEAKRIADLMSKAQKEEARANKAEAALKAVRGESGSAGSNDPATRALMAELREASLDAVFGEYPELRDYGIDRALIEGSTRAEMREAASALVTLIKNVSTKARNKALAESGIKPEPTAARRASKSVADMTDDEFLKMLDSI